MDGQVDSMQVAARWLTSALAIKQLCHGIRMLSCPSISMHTPPFILLTACTHRLFKLLTACTQRLFILLTVLQQMTKLELCLQSTCVAVTLLPLYSSSTVFVATNMASTSHKVGLHAYMYTLRKVHMSRTQLNIVTMHSRTETTKMMRQRLTDPIEAA